MRLNPKSVCYCWHVPGCYPTFRQVNLLWNGLKLTSVPGSVHIAKFQELFLLLSPSGLLIYISSLVTHPALLPPLIASAPVTDLECGLLL